MTEMEQTEFEFEEPDEAPPMRPEDSEAVERTIAEMLDDFEGEE